MTGSWPSASKPPIVVDEAAAVTEVQVRLPAGPQRLRLNRSHTVGEFKQCVELALDKAGEVPRAYALMCGFPPKPLNDDSITLEGAGLVGAAVTLRWT